MTGSRQFFRKGVHARAHPVIRKPRPKHRGVVLLVTEASGHTRYMASAEVAMQKGRSKGGRTAHERGTRYCWTPEQARDAAKKAWRTRWRMNKRINVRLGRPAKQRPAVNHAKLRAYYHAYPLLGITCEGLRGDNVWVWTQDNQRISERTALIRLGHLPPPRKRGFLPIDDGIVIAHKKPTTR